MDELDLQIRRMRYRLNRQGMLELDAWLAPLLKADWLDAEVYAALQTLLAYEAPDLQRMMHGGLPIPEALKDWLVCG